MNAGFKRIASALLGFGESDTSGAWCKFRIETDDLPVFRGRKGLEVELVFRFRNEQGHIIDPDTGVMLHPETESPPSAESAESAKPLEYGQWWRKAIQAGVFWNTDPALYQAIAGKNTDERFREWVSKQPCCVSGGWDETESAPGSFIQKNEFAHILRADAKPSGAKGPGSNKPVFSGIGIQSEYHKIQHAKGWAGVANIASMKTAPHTEAAGVEWAMKHRARLLEKWCKKELCLLFDVKSRSEIPPDLFIGWCEKQNIKLPRQLLK